MLTKEFMTLVERSYQHGGTLVFMIKNKEQAAHGRVFITDTIMKHQKDGTIEMQDCYEVDMSCFEQGSDGSTVYYGDTIGDSVNFIFNDPEADNPNSVATIYYVDEIQED